ncbi:hypothetical protein [uncultured Sphingomonas sp.]|uniref:hypothetical protein n=1 Tax=uncultured Sphingomonas sp. TaxID=158754 RepID=UPI0025EC20E3|nr:hypothetical protein [uncultured Sphingomonas sp.]
MVLSPDGVSFTAAALGAAATFAALRRPNVTPDLPPAALSGIVAGAAVARA